ncbi:chromosome partition protein Smc-like [Parasteatoda tepidariorum]|uniref:chromosome partition protein Smc-like n=1 Tax=Parasteatoda tepidariorum TaxID=114398 RepID=UPI001C726F31|nr:uncharacterized protein LOC107456983 [Parasteatoda tepidariorum]
MFTKSKSDTLKEISSLERLVSAENRPNLILNSPYNALEENTSPLDSSSKTYEECLKSNDNYIDNDIFGNSSSRTYVKLPQIPEFLKIKLPYDDPNNTSWIIQSLKSISKTSAQENRSIEVLHEIENILTTQFYYCLNQNHILKRELACARAVVKKEIFCNSVNFAELYKKAVDGKWKGREELILHLKEKIHGLTHLVEKREKDLDIQWPKGKRISFLELTGNPMETLHTESVNSFSYLEEEKEKQLKVQQHLREKLGYFSKANKDLAEEANHLKKETSVRTLSSSDDLYKKLRDLEIQIKHCLDRKSQDIKSLTKEESLTYELVKEIANLKNRIQKEKQVIAESEERLTSLKSFDTNSVMQKGRNSIIESTNRSIKTLEDMAREYHKQLNHLRLFVNDDNTISFISSENHKEIARSRSKNLSGAQIDNSKNISKRSYNQVLVPVNAKRKAEKILRFRSPLTSEMIFPVLTGGTLECKPSLLEEFYRIKSSCERNEERNLDRLANMYVHLEKMRDTMQQLLQEQSTLFNVMYKNRLLGGIYKQLCSKNTGLKSETYRDVKCLEHSKHLDGAKILLGALRDEKKFLNYCIDRIYHCKEDDLDFLISGMSEIENLFRNGLCD